MNSQDLTKQWFGELYFDEETHTYTDDYGTEYSSVTEYISTFFPAFIQEEQAKAFSERLKAKGVNKTPEQILEAWDEKRLFGSKIHARIEELLANPTHVPKDDVLEGEHLMVRSALRVVRGLKTLHDIRRIYPEVKVFNKDLRLAGTIDLLMITKDEKIILGDFKTSNSIYKGFKKHETHELTKDLSSSNYVKYCLQLNAYEALLPVDKEVLDSYIIHLKPYGSEVKLYKARSEEYKDKVTQLLGLRGGKDE